MSETALRAAVVGAGPSGFYATDQLLKAGFEVDLLEILPTPFGLVRAGVAPDHPKIKSVTRVYEKTANHPGFRFYGGVELGGHVSRQDLLDRYHAVLYAVGTASDNKLGIPGEDRPGSHGALEFVAWYNGHPDYADHEFDLSATRAVVIGNGNVAVDVARMLVLDPDEMAVTDTADHAIAPLGAASVHEVIVLGRRGPAQAAFTTPELRELGELTRADIIVDPADLELDPYSAQWLEERGRADQQAQRRADARVRRSASRTATSAASSCASCARRWRSSATARTAPVTGVRIGNNKIEDGRAVPTGEEEIISCGLVIRSIGYRGTPLAGIPFDERRGLISNLGGRVLGHERRARGRRVRRRLGQARPVRRDRHQQEGRDGHRRPDPRGPRRRQAQHAQGRRTGEDVPRVPRRGVPERRHVGGLARDRRARDRPRRAAGPPAREARAHGRDGRHRLRRADASRQRDVAEEPVLAPAEVHAGDLLDPAEAVVEARAVQPQLGGGLLDVAGVVEVGLQRQRELLVLEQGSGRRRAGRRARSPAARTAAAARAGRPSASTPLSPECRSRAAVRAGSVA